MKNEAEENAMTSLSAWKMASTIFVLCAAMAIAASAQTFNTLADFEGNNGSYPDYISLIQSVDGNFYGTTLYGGQPGNNQCDLQGCGTAFKITTQGVLTALFSFCHQSGCTDGGVPVAGLVLATDGNFYGTGGGGGTHSGGTLFRLTQAGVMTTLYDFCGGGNGCGGPEDPFSPLVQGIGGNFYGTTLGGGYDTCGAPKSERCGTLFEMTARGIRVGVYRFCSEMNCADGFFPSGLVQDADGNLYGTTIGGGANDGGTVFKITPKGGLTTLYNFCSQPNCTDGSDPFAGLIQGTDGNFYGTTAYGGSTSCGTGINCGTVFKITPTGTLTTLYSFCAQAGCADGYFPYAGLIQGTDGNFYGTTNLGGSDLIDCTSQVGGCGTVFQITSGGALTRLHSFSNTDGALPRGGLLQASNGTFYGTTSYGGGLTCPDGGQSGCGTVFSVDMGLGPFVAFVHAMGKVGQTGDILGQGFTGTTSVSLNGIPASFTVVSDTYIRATVPAGATTGYVTVTTPSSTLTSNVPFHVIP
jgi:uncharacterized repeat protein (TIGR03803 family)